MAPLLQRLRLVSLVFVSTLIFVGSGLPAVAMSDAELMAIVAKRLAGDRTGAHLAVAVIERGEVARAFVGAQPSGVGARIDEHSAFEIGSITKTMTAALLADLILRGQASLDEPLSAWLPEGTPVPSFKGKPILLRHIVTHTSGLPALPPRLRTKNHKNPYAKLSERGLLDVLADVQLRAAPGKRFEYSNYGFMLLSYALAQRAEAADFESLLRERLFTPLGMQGAYVTKRPKHVRAATGHTPHNAAPAPAWYFPPRMAGTGGARATLDDMLRYLQVQLEAAQRYGGEASPLHAAIKLSQKRLSRGEPALGMAWMQGSLYHRRYLFHAGTTGGFSTYIAFFPKRQRGVIILSDTAWDTSLDTAWSAISSLENLALHLLDSRVPLDAPRKICKPPQKLLTALEGRYRLSESRQLQLQQDRGALYAITSGQPPYRMGYDSAGDFFPLAFNALLRPVLGDDGTYSLTWLQGGGSTHATRLKDETKGRKRFSFPSDKGRHAQHTSRIQ